MISRLLGIASVALCIGTGCATDEKGTAVGRYADINGLKLYYEVHGSPAADGNAPPLVLLHGGGSTIETSFGATLPILAKTRQVIAFDQQGQGRTNDVAGRPFTFEQSADDAAALLRHLGVARADFCGYSNGGSIAMQVAIRHPSLVRKLVVISAMVSRDAMPPEFWEGMRDVPLERMPAELREAYLRVAPHPEQLRTMHDKCAERMRTFTDWPDDVVRSIDKPTLVMIGDADIVRPEHAVEMYRLLPDAQLAVLPGTDHMAIVDRAALLTGIIPAFLDAPAR